MRRVLNAQAVQEAVPPKIESRSQLLAMYENRSESESEEGVGADSEQYEDFDTEEDEAEEAEEGGIPDQTYEQDRKGAAGLGHLRPVTAPSDDGDSDADAHSF